MGHAGRGGKRRYAIAVLSIAGTLALVGCGGLGLLPYQTSVSNTDFKSYAQLEEAYARIVPGQTRASDLGAMGFDVARSSNVKVLSYLGILERFMPRQSTKFDQLAPAVRSCMDSRDSCMAYVFRPKRLEQEHRGNALLSMVGFDRSTLNSGWAAEVVLLIEDGRVAYKAMTGHPNIENALTPPKQKAARLMRTASRD